jgi:chemotaxis regulatin CheY-phosphate phosphatase CheZ
VYTKVDGKEDTTKMGVIRELGAIRRDLQDILRGLQLQEYRTNSLAVL